ncbi:hypothetical protein MNB_SM-6-43 [hydrothermal vent metagenome]|uniref:Lipoprotein n=1 Tax=hydrothermal vent metagenome TaxID=652676 RepID=A0A1W1CWZ8_9ZZZZ
MYKKIIAISVATATLMFSGCGDGDKASCGIEVQQDIDHGNFDAAINKLKGSCSQAFTKSDLNLNLAAAYMGKSGYGVSDVIKIIMDANDDSSSNAFSSFTSSVSKNKKADSMPLLKKAQSYFLKSIADGNNTSAGVLCSPKVLKTTTNSRVQNVCLYVGINQTVTTANTISYLTKDVTTLTESINNKQNTTPLDMQASLDALAWATGTAKTNITASDVNISLDGNNPTAYKHLVVIEKDNNNNNLTFYRLANALSPSSNGTTVLTDGYCTADGNKTACEGIEDNATGAITDTSKACYACPVSFEDNNNSGSIAQLLVDTLNNGTDTISAISDDPDIEQSIKDFKTNITDGTDRNITVDDILKYLNK